MIVGLAREGTALARFLAERGATVTITDAKPAEALADNLAALADLPLRLALGGHPTDLLDEADILFVSPGVPLEIPFLAEARQRGLPLSSEVRLFTRLCPAPIIGITGSSGKTTTTTLVGEMLRTAGRTTWVGGNIGRPLIAHLDEIQAGDLVVMELSSFQLEFFGEWDAEKLGAGNWELGIEHWASGWSPPLAAVLNVTPNHLDRHPSMEAYIAAKEQIWRHQRPGDRLILNRDNPVTRRMGTQAAMHNPQTAIFWFSLEGTVAQGAFRRGHDLILRRDRLERRICRRDELALLGRHNVANVLAAAVLADVAGAPLAAIRQAATTFAGVPHRLELVRERDGVRWYNDSIATTPERTVAALRSFREPLVLLAGGRDKHLPWDQMAALTRRKVRHLILFGEAADLIEDAVRQAGGAQMPEIHRAGTLEQAVATAAQVAQPGDVVLLSPGGTSFDAYRDFEERGEHFRQLVAALGD